MSDTFTGRARILDLNGLLVDVGKANLQRMDADSGATWGGTIRLYVNAALSSKTMESILDLENGNRARALVGPQVGGVVDGELVDVRVVALQSEVPF
ncbi:MAG: hypothetical protein WEA76_10490 [Acidimicrobiia bacterium]